MLVTVRDEAGLLVDEDYEHRDACAKSCDCGVDFAIQIESSSDIGGRLVCPDKSPSTSVVQFFDCSKLEESLALYPCM